MAVKPEFFKNLPSLNKEEIQTDGKPTDEERMLYGLSQTAGWAILTKYIEELLEDFETMNDTAIANGATYEDLGKNTLVISLSRGIIRSIINKVTDAKESCEREQPTGATQ